MVCLSGHKPASANILAPNGLVTKSSEASGTEHRKITAPGVTGLMRFTCSGASAVVNAKQGAALLCCQFRFMPV